MSAWCLRTFNTGVSPDELCAAIDGVRCPSLVGTGARGSGPVQACGPVEEVPPLHQVGGPACGLAGRVDGVGVVTGHLEQMRPDRLVAVPGRQPIVGTEGLEQGESGRGPFDHGDGDRAVEGHDRARGHVLEQSVEGP